MKVKINIKHAERSDKRPSAVNDVSNKIISKMVIKNASNTDPFGSYTGKPVNHYERPVQDADDL